MRTRRLLVLLVLMLLVVGCGTRQGPDVATPAAPQSPSPPASSTDLQSADRLAVEALASVTADGDASDSRWGEPIFHFLTGDGRVVDQQPWTACLGNGCWDGAPGLAGEIPSVGSPDALYFAFDYPGWRFHWVSFNPVDDDCGGRTISVRATAVTDRVFRVDPAGLRGEWRVDVFGRGADGDAVASVLWKTPGDGSMPEPGATGSLFTDQDDKRVAPFGGPELHLVDLASTPATASGSWTVTDAAGRSVTVPLRREEVRCQRDGAVSFRGPELTPAELARLSGESVTYAVEITLDGETYTGSARWPQDETAEAPYTRFTFDPPLPAYRG